MMHFRGFGVIRSKSLDGRMGVAFDPYQTAAHFSQRDQAHGQATSGFGLDSKTLRTRRETLGRASEVRNLHSQ
jgi:hypothetical protein